MKKLIFTTYAYIGVILLTLAVARFGDWSMNSMMPAMLVFPICLSIIIGVVLGWFIEGMFGIAFSHFAFSSVTFFAVMKTEQVMAGQGQISAGQMINLVFMYLLVIATLVFFAFLIGEAVDENLYRRWAVIPSTIFCLSYGITLYVIRSQWNWIPGVSGIILLSVYFRCLRYIRYAEPEATGSWSPTTSADPDDYHRNCPPY